VAVCNLASVSLKKFVENGEFNHQKLYDICYKITENLNNVIDITRYPVIEAERSNLKHRPIGIGMQGLADTFILLRFPFDSPQAKQLNREIAETMYFAAASASCDLARKYGHYASFKWNTAPTFRWNFGDLREAVIRHGMRNSLLMAPMPTASTASILGNIEAFEPLSSNLYSRNILAGTFTMLNKYLVDDLLNRKLWNSGLKDRIIANNGSIQGINEIPKDIQLLYRTAYELSMRDLIDMCADRSPFICQSQSFNVFMAVPNYAKMTSMHFYGWEKKLKSGMYYLRTKPATDATKFTLDVSKAVVDEKKDESEWVCTMEDGCLSCGS
jgi:ribonucleoside-diphosphate reductase alpha chain